MLKSVQVIAWFAVLLTSSVASAAYLDAEPGSGGNTVQASDGDVSAWMVAATGLDGKWGKRGFGLDQNGVFNGASKDIYEATGNYSSGEDCMMIITTISGLTAGQLYQVDVAYWSSIYIGVNWNVRAGFDDNNLILFDRTGALGTAGTETGITDSDRILLTGTIGQITADINGQIKVYIDDLPGSGNADRSWYDGLYYEEIETGCSANLLYDFTGPEGEPDCKVDLYDLAEMAAHWMECTRVPESACQE